MRAFPAFLALFILVFQLRALAETTTDEHQTRQLPPLTVTAMRLPSQPDLDSATITVITRDDIDRTGAHTVAELLRFVPGADVRITGQTGGQTSVFLRGANSNHTLVLIDGIRVNSAFSGNFDFSSLTVANVERVEVIHGPQSLLYGSEALGGIVNIVTRRGAAGASGSLRAAVGSHGETEGRAAATFGGERARASVTGSWLETDNDRDNSAYRARDLAVSGDWEVSSRLALGFQASLFDSETGIPNDRFTNDPNDQGQALNKLAALSLDGDPLDWWNLGLTVSRARDRLKFDGPEPNPPFFSGDVNSLTTGRRDLVDLQNVLALATDHRLLLGATYERTEVDHSASSSFGDTQLEPDQESRSVFGAYSWSGDSFEVNGGGRLDDYTSFGSHETWRLGGRLTVTERLVARANVGTGFRAPSLVDLFYPGFSNPDLEPEESLGWDLGLEARIGGDDIRVSAVWFGNRFDNLIAFSTTAFRPENIAEARTSGLESSLDWEIGDGWNMRASYTWLETAEDRTTGMRLLRRAEHSGSVDLFGEIRSGLGLDARVRLAGSSDDRDFWAFPAREVANAGYVKWDLGATARLNSHLTAHGRVENLFDAQYEEAYGFPALGRTGRIGLTYDF
ncbi:MAG: TonB-dependent receptor [Candidatus Krumholzibacteriota bacterium]